MSKFIYETLAYEHIEYLLSKRFLCCSLCMRLAILLANWTVTERPPLLCLDLATAQARDLYAMLSIR